MLPLINALTAARHQVLVAVEPHLLGAVDDLPVERAPVLPDPFADRPEFTRPVEVPVLEIFAAPHVSAGYRALLPVARGFRPDLVLRDGGEFSGLLVAEALGVPQLAASGTANVLDPAELQPVLNRRRGEVGLPTVADPGAIHRYGRLESMPEQYSFTAWRDTGTVHRYQQPAAIRAGGSLPGWLAELPAEQPLVVAAVGTVLPASVFDAARLLRTITAALGELDCQAVVATGGVELGPVAVPSDRVHLVDRVDQPLLLRCAQLLVTHGGYNSVREAIGAGVPMAVLPCFGDQHTNAERVHAHGLGRHLPATTSPGELASLVRELLADTGVTARIRQAQRRMLALPPVEAVVDLLEKLVRSSARR
jgi:N-glycosyltransferase